MVLGAVRRRRAHPGAGALLLHQLLEALVVDREALLGEQLLRQVVGEAVGVVQPERVGGVDPRGLLLARALDQLAQHLAAAVERPAEALLLVADPAHHGLALGGELGIGRRQDLERALGEAVDVGRLEADRPALLDRAAHDPAQHVAAVLVRGHDAVGDHRRHARASGRPGSASRGWWRRRPRSPGPTAPRPARRAAAACRSRTPTGRPGGSPPSAPAPCPCRCSSSAARSASRPRGGRRS